MTPLALALSLVVVHAPPPTAGPTAVLVVRTGEAGPAASLPALVTAELSRERAWRVLADPDPTTACASIPCALSRLETVGGAEVVLAGTRQEEGRTWVTLTRHDRRGALLAESTRALTGDDDGALVEAVRGAVADVTAPPAWERAAGAGTPRAPWLQDLTLRRLAMVVVGGLGMAVSFVAVCVAIGGMAIAGGVAAGNAVQAMLLATGPAPRTGSPDPAYDSRMQLAYQASGIIAAGSAAVGFALLGLLGSSTGLATLGVFLYAVLT